VLHRATALPAPSHHQRPSTQALCSPPPGVLLQVLGEEAPPAAGMAHSLSSGSVTLVSGAAQWQGVMSGVPPTTLLVAMFGLSTDIVCLTAAAAVQVGYSFGQCARVGVGGTWCCKHGNGGGGGWGLASIYSSRWPTVIQHPPPLAAPSCLLVACPGDQTCSCNSEMVLLGCKFRRQSLILKHTCCPNLYCFHA
jgi:hypothetical protein